MEEMEESKINYRETSSEIYEKFVDKFKVRHTTDDCLTPPKVYDAVERWVCDKYGISKERVVRPFWPGMDYRNELYSAEQVVVDNPPFSILSEICRWYDKQGIPFFLFAQEKTLFSVNHGSENYVVADCDITYDNGAVVRTGYVTNLGEDKVLLSKSLHDAVDQAVKATQDETAVRKGKKKATRYEMPYNVITAARISTFVKWQDCDIGIPSSDCAYIRNLDNPDGSKIKLYGQGFLLSRRAAETMEELDHLRLHKKEARKLMHTDRQRVRLSEKEQAIVDKLGKEQAREAV